MKTMPLALLAASFILVACEKAPPPPTETAIPTSETADRSPSSPRSSSSASSQAASSAPNTAPDDAIYTTYHCDNGKSVEARYTDNDEAPAATLVIDNKHYAMYRVVSASGARYASEQGLLPNEGMQWYVQNGEAMLVAMVLDHTANPDEAQVLFRCQVEQNL